MGPVSKEQAAAVVTGFILDPNVTCEQLRNEFQLIYLPLVNAPNEVGLAYEEGWIVADDQAVLRVWHLPAKLNRGTVLLSTGAVGEMPCYLFVAKMLVDLGWSVVMYDYRGFGGSSGTPSVDKLASDLGQVLDWALERSGRSQLTLMGISLGSIPTVAVGVERPEAVNGVVLDSPVALGETLARFEFILPDSAHVLVNLLGPELKSESIIGELTQPLLILEGEADLITTPGTVQVLYERAGGPKRIAHFPGIGHARAPYRDTADYMSQVESFLGSVWGQAAQFELIVRP